MIAAPKGVQNPAYKRGHRKEKDEKRHRMTDVAFSYVSIPTQLKIFVKNL